MNRKSEGNFTKLGDPFLDPERSEKILGFLGDPFSEITENS
jgi:hypothetical protein